MTSKQVTSPPWNSRRLVHSKEMAWASRWSVALRAFYRQILSSSNCKDFFFKWHRLPRKLAKEVFVKFIPAKEKTRFAKEWRKVLAKDHVIRIDSHEVFNTAHLLYIKPPCHLGAQPSASTAGGVTISGPPGTMKLKPMTSHHWRSAKRNLSFKMGLDWKLKQNPSTGGGPLVGGFREWSYTVSLIIGIHEPFIPYFSGQPVKPETWNVKFQVSTESVCQLVIWTKFNSWRIWMGNSGLWTLFYHWDLRPLTVTFYVFGSNKLTKPSKKGHVVRLAGTYLQDFHVFSRWWFQMLFIFISTWGNDPIWLRLFRWVVEPPPSFWLKFRWLKGVALDSVLKFAPQKML